MDQIKTGKFIAEERKNKKLTQRQLAEILNISDKTISKWETGNGFPEISLLQPLCRRIPVVWGLVLNVLLSFCFWKIGDGLLFFGVSLPRSWYEGCGDWLCPLGIHSSTFFSSDYFPLLPWVFVFFFGVFLGRLAKEGKFPRFFAASHIPFFAFTGRHALLIYILHQPVILGISYGVQALLSLGRG